MEQPAPRTATRRAARGIRSRPALVLVAALALVLTACNVGKVGPTYVQAANPTVSKPQSKLWFQDGHWWGAMLETSQDGTDANVTIHRLDPGGWVSTGVVIDSRGTTKVDVVSSGPNLWTVAHKFTGTATGVPEPLLNNQTQINRFTYNTVTHAYTVVAGFPRLLNPFSMESITVDIDSAGTLWAAWVQAQQVVWQRSTDGGLTWSPAAALTDPHATTTTDDIASLVAFGTSVGIMWSDQTGPNDGFWFVTAPAGPAPFAWTPAEPAYVGLGLGDDHVNLKANGDGTVYAAVKTGNDTGANPSVVLLQRTPGGAWSGRTAWVGLDNVTRPVVQLDVSNANAIVLATGPNTAGSGTGELGGAIYQKKVPLAGGAFTAGLGTKVMGRGDTGTLNDVTGSKLPVNTTTGLVMIAADAATMQYWYSVDTLTPPAP